MDPLEVYVRSISHNAPQVAQEIYDLSPGTIHMIWRIAYGYAIMSWHQRKLYVDRSLVNQAIHEEYVAYVLGQKDPNKDETYDEIMARAPLAFDFNTAKQLIYGILVKVFERYPPVK